MQSPPSASTTTGDVAIYARYSTDRQDARSMDDQVPRCRCPGVCRVSAEDADAAISGSQAVLEADTEAARALLGRHMPPLALAPEGSTYRITGGFDLSLCLDDQQAPGPLGDRDAAESTPPSR